MPYSATTQAQVLLVLARILANQGDNSAARESYGQAVAVLAPLVGKYPSYAKVRDLQAAAETELRSIAPARATASSDN